MPSWSERPPRHQAPCELCPQPGQLAQRLDPHNWQPHTRRLCRKHREQLGYHPVDWGRGVHVSGRMPR